MNNDILVSIICNTYNHESYIRDALESFVMQKTDFAYEVLVHDDASTDGTADIVREYEKKYPDLIKPIYQTENQYSKGVTVSDINRKRAKGKYMAVCEGDDYWTDPYKLQKQYDAMERHPEVDMCAHAVQRVQADSKRFITMIAPADGERLLTLEEIILEREIRLETNSLFYRSAILENSYEFRKVLKMDYTLKVLGALRGGIWYLPECMSAYRVSAKGSWTLQMRKNTSKWLELFKRKKNMLTTLDWETDYKYSETINQEIHRLEWFQLEVLHDYKEMLSPQYADMFAEYPRMHKVKIWIRAYMPWIIKIKERFKA